MTDELLYWAGVVLAVVGMALAAVSILKGLVFR